MTDWLTDRLTKRLSTSWLKILWYPYELIILNLFTLLAWIIHLYLLSCIPSFLTKNDWLTSRGSIHSLIGSYFAMQMLCTLPVLFIINKLLDMLNTLTKPRFQTFVKIFQGPTDTPSPRSSSSELKKCIDCIWFHLLPIFWSSYCCPSNLQVIIINYI